jgi:preprotein translocase subunit SecY
MISAFANCFKIPELRKRILFTLALLAICRIGAAIPLPGVIPMAVKEALERAGQAGGGGFLGLYNIFTGGALENCSTFALGIMPYISASIIMQLMTAVVPTLQRMIREHEQGRARFIQYTRYLTVALCLVQGWLMAVGFEKPEALFGSALAGVDVVADPGWGFRIMAVITMTTSTMILMWLGEQITALGIGNGISLIITIGIVARLPNALYLTWQLFWNPAAVGSLQQYNIFHALGLIGMLIVVIAGIIAVTQAQRKIPVQYAKRMVGRKMTTGGTTFMPLRVNYSGVMPIIFAQAILMFPSKIFQLLHSQWNLAIFRWLAQNFNETTFVYIASYGVLIFFFAYFWVTTQFNPIQVSEDLKKHGGYIPGIRPGKQTADFLEKTMNRITFGGAAFLTIIAVLPILLADWVRIPYQTAQFFGGTSMLIAVGVMLDTMRQVETHLLTRHYDGFLRKGKLRGRTGFGPTLATQGAGPAGSEKIWYWIGGGLVALLGLGWVLRQFVWK